MLLRFLILEESDKAGLVQTLAQIRIVSILDGVVCAAIHLLGNVAPSVTVHKMQLDNEHVFLHGPLALADVWIQVIMPSLSTLLSNAPWQALGHLGPVLGTLRRDDVREDLILLLRPGALGEMAAVVKLEPASVTLDLRLAGQKLTNTIPRVLAKSLDIVLQLFIL